jgi:hypothetical protein
MLMYPFGCLLAAAILSAPYLLSNYLGVVRMRKTALCSSGPIAFLGIKLFLLPMLACAWIAPFLFWICQSAGSPLRPAHELLLLTLSSLLPYIFVRACPQAFRPAGWVTFLCFYFWSHWNFMQYFVAAASEYVYSSDAVRFSLGFLIPLYAFLQNLLSRSVMSQKRSCHAIFVCLR